jgi:hypothetical protein
LAVAREALTIFLEDTAGVHIAPRTIPVTGSHAKNYQVMTNIRLAVSFDFPTLTESVEHHESQKS